ncbi:uncharacterized protein F4807DRAFT_439697 [Annulohypoxylon truncatum]|uniref:uncharacterized protein n=1 Tax=Annulohypoxylon truncatum TaxID=327061 RepID=UPI002007D428|nr:uncharacterized protein F4807DRAFT_439697 [Annulohypoxylon truncatum]KAI1206319.1 hypothetical protein F4807DRAFT_439697 [Annulohypoxylon truncatum]
MPLSNIEGDGPVRSAITTGLVVVSVIFPVLSAIAIGLRFLARRRSRQTIRADDAWVIVAWIFTFALSVLVWVFTDRSGINYYNIDPLQGTIYSLELIFISSCLIQFPLSTVKISILLFYRRIFVSRKFHIAVWIAIAVVTIWGLLFFFLVLTQVDPISDSWKGGRLRYDSTALGLAQVGTSIALDFVVLCFPLPVISNLHMASKRKIAVALIFWLGAFCCVAAVVRLVFLDQSVRAVIKSENNVYLQSKQYIFLILEPNCSIIAACLPCYGPLFAGGRAPESIVRSVRSIFSLRSLGSKGSAHGSRDGNGSRSKDSNRSNGSHGNGAGGVGERGEPTESQIELSIQQWPGKGQQDVHCVGGKMSDDVEALSLEGQGINVTNGVTVERE